MKHPDAIAWEKFQRANPHLFDATTLGTNDPARYLSNRLWDAFMTGRATARKESPAGEAGKE